MFLGFRNNACYDRWGEARKVWVKLVHVARSFARETMVLDQMPGKQGVRAKLLDCVNGVRAVDGAASSARGWSGTIAQVAEC
ncbi:bestrophin family ion channel [Brucella pseudogrignonensis]|nr:bestrophin family ion channel [Brucella pseudogrignonensis]MDT6941735.1 bestrophin family ion channel [Brucella pseudogrignonensis]